MSSIMQRFNHNTLGWCSMIPHFPQFNPDLLLWITMLAHSRLCNKLLPLKVIVSVSAHWQVQWTTLHNCIKLNLWQQLKLAGWVSGASNSQLFWRSKSVPSCQSATPCSQEEYFDCSNYPLSLPCWNVQMGNLFPHQPSCASGEI